MIKDIIELSVEKTEDCFPDDTDIEVLLATEEQVDKPGSPSQQGDMAKETPIAGKPLEEQTEANKDTEQVDKGGPTGGVLDETENINNINVSS